MSPLFVRIIEIFVIAQACYVLGISFVIFLHYSFRDRRLVHIGLIALSYVMLTLLNASRIYLMQGSYEPVRLVWSFTAYAIGDYALWWMLKHGRRQVKV